MSKKTALKSTDEKEYNVILKKITEILYNRTCAWGTKNGLTQKDSVKKSEKQKYSDKAVKIATILNNHDFSTHSAAVKELFEVILNEKLPSLKKEKAFIVYESGVVVVPLSDPNRHNYPLGQPILVTKGTGFGIGAQDKSGAGTLPNDSLTAIRPATLNEIESLLEAFMESKKDNSFNTIMASFFLDEIK